MSTWLTALAHSMDRGLALIKTLLDELWRRHILAPALPVLGLGRTPSRPPGGYQVLSADLTSEQRVRLDELLTPRADSRQTLLGW